MKKVILNFSAVGSREDVHALLRRELDLPEYYGNNLDALHDCLTDICEDTAIGLYRTEDGSPVSAYLRKVQQVFADAEKEDPHLAVFFLTTFGKS